MHDVWRDDGVLMSDKIKDGLQQGREIAQSALFSLACSDNIMTRALAAGMALGFIEVSAAVLAATCGPAVAAKSIGEARDRVLKAAVKIEEPAGSA